MFVGPETFKVAGTSHYLGEILALATSNDDYKSSKRELLEYYEAGDKIPQFTFPKNLRVNLVDEPENQYDPDAIRVELNGRKVGYIGKESTGQVRDIRNEPDVKIKAEIVGGSFKQVHEDDDGKGYVETVDLSYGVRLTFYTSEYDISDGFRDAGVIKLDAPPSATSGAVESHAQNPNETNTKTSFIGKVGSFLLWVLAVLFLVAGLGWLLSGSIASIAYILAAVITVPIATVQKFVHELNLKGMNKVICVLVLLAIGSYLLPPEEHDAIQETSAETQETIPAVAEVPETQTQPQAVRELSPEEEKVQTITRNIKAKFSSYGYAEMQDMTISENLDTEQEGDYNISIEADYTAHTDEHERIRNGVNGYMESLIEMVSADCPSVQKISVRWDLRALWHNRMSFYAIKVYERVWDSDNTYMVLTEETWPDEMNG